MTKQFASAFAWLCVAILLVFPAPSVVMAQTSATGSLTGTVTDPTGAVVPNVTVTATSSTGQARTTTTGGDGSYTISLLPPGEYRVKFEAAGFQVVEVPAVTVTVTETGTLNRQITVGSQTQEVTVQANVETVQTSSSAVGTVVAGQVMTDLPLSTRNYTNLLTMVAGANASVQNATAIGKGGDQVAVNGASTAQNSFMMDGVTLGAAGGSNALAEAGTYGSIGIPDPDALQEFKIQTSTYDASYGRNPGGSVNVVTKTGTNEFHGDAFEFFRNTVLNANDFFLNKAGRPEGVLNQNQYGGILGGPVKKDKLFFFVSYQNTWQRNGFSVMGFQSGINLPPIPTISGGRGSCPLGVLAESGCDAQSQAFATALGAAICPQNNANIESLASQQDGVTRANFLTTKAGDAQVACNGSNINPVALRTLQLKFPNGNYYIPTSGQPITTATQGYLATSFSRPGLFTEKQGNANGDYVINSKNTLSLKQFYSREDTFAPFDDSGAGVGTIFLPGSAANLGYLYDNSLVKLTTLVSTNFVNEARISYQRDATYISPTTSEGETSLFTNQQVGITPIQAGINDLSYLQISGLFQIGIQDSSWVYAHSNDFQVADQISWTHGKHTFRSGVEIVHELWHYNLVGFPIGQAAMMSFGDFLLGLPGCAPGTPAATCAASEAAGTTNGTGFGTVQSITTTDRTLPGGNIHNLLTHSADAFIQDDLKISPRLTLNLGLRYEFYSVMYDQQGQITSQWAGLIATQPIPGTGCVYNGFSWGAGAAGTGCSFVGFVAPSNYQVSRLGPLPPGVFQNNRPEVVQNSPPWDNFAPRLGFAWQPLSTDRFVVRGGFGYYYDKLDGGRIGTGFPNEPPYVTPLASTGSALVASSLANPFPSTPLGWLPRWANLTTGAQSNYTLGGGSGQLSPTFVTPLVYQYGLNTQYEFLRSWVLETGYAGSLGIHQTGAVPINTPLLANAANPLYGVVTNSTTSGAAGPAIRVPYLGFSTTQDNQCTCTNYKYNSLQVSVRKHMSQGLSLQAAYTWSRAFIQSYVGNPNTSFTSNVPYLLEYGPNTSYHPQRLTFSYDYELTFGHHTGLMEKVADGWMFSGVTTIQDGLPMTITDSRLGTVFGGLTSNATYAPGFGPRNIEASGSLYSKVLGNYFMPGAFTATANPASGLAGCGSCTGTLYGSSGLGVVLGPGQNNFDMSLSKITKVGGLREDATLQFRAEFFNIFNHPQFSNPLLTANSGTFGTITSASVNQRLIQLALKYVF